MFWFHAELQAHHDRLEEFKVSPLEDIDTYVVPCLPSSEANERL
jgi:hypothetical protein